MANEKSQNVQDVFLNWLAVLNAITVFSGRSQVTVATTV